MGLSLQPFNGATPALILDALHRDCPPAQIAGVMFHAEIPPVRSLDPRDQWLRLKGIIGCPAVYDAFGISSLPIDPPAPFHYAVGLETIGTLANLLTRSGVHRKFVDDHDAALGLSKTFLDSALVGCYESAEAYSCRDAWCDWFIGDGILDETLLLGCRGDWWLLAVTGTD